MARGGEFDNAYLYAHFAGYKIAKPKVSAKFRKGARFGLGLSALIWACIVLLLVLLFF